MGNSKTPYFFKVFFPDRSSAHLRLPPAFGEHIEDELNRNVSLKGPSGNIWRVKLVKDSDGFYFKDGWKDFVADHSLVMGDFLVFRYNRRSTFRVFVFDPTACEKKTAFCARPSTVEEETEVNDESEELEGGASIGDEDENTPLVLFKRRRIEWNLKRKRRDDDPSKKKRKLSKSARPSPNSLNLITPKQECLSYSTSTSSESSKGTLTVRKEKSRYRNSASSLRTSALYKKFKLANENGEVSGSKHHSHKKSTSKNSGKYLELVDSNEISRPVRVRAGSLISKRRPITNEEAERTFERAMQFKSEHPFVVTVMQESYVYTSFFMSLPSWFVREHLPNEKTELTVWDPNGQPWKMNFVCYGLHGALSGGWGKFSFAHNIEKYDVCIFELIKENNLKVHIYRVVEEIIPLVRLNGKYLRSQTLLGKYMQ